MNISTTIANSILIFDSGIGGISIVDEIVQRLPHSTLVYVADNKLYPYGTQTEEALVTRALTLFPALEARYCPAVIVIACNSASTIMLDEVRKITHIPVIGVVPAIKPAARHSKSGNIGLLATKGTISRQYTESLISQFASTLNMIKIGSDVLVSLAENKSRGLPVDMNILERELSPLLDAKNVDTVVLGCTHFPLISQEIHQLLGSHITLIDSGKAVARRTEEVLLTLAETNASQKNHDAEKAPHTFAFTACPPNIEQIKPFLRSRGFRQVHTINI
ncbi:glutamate racemase [Gammaproteobacteria bacterium 45_16_T64]|nr:glutamate racemase [Gammaproteobacteria bacterium 45_16_T64]